MLSRAGCEWEKKDVMLGANMNGGKSIGFGIIVVEMAEDGGPSALIVPICSG